MYIDGCSLHCGVVCAVISTDTSKQLVDGGMEGNSAQVTQAVETDLDDLVTVINDAYLVERGDSGVAFKAADRIVDGEKQLLPAIRDGRVWCAILDGKIVGCIVATQHDDVMSIGPFAVLRAAQGKRIGRVLMDKVSQIALDSGCHFLELDVVNVRTDLLPMYEKMGFVITEERPFPDGVYTTRPVHFIVMRKLLTLE